MLNDHALVVVGFVAIFLLGTFDDFKELFIRQSFVTEWVNADMMDGFLAFGVTGHCPHILKGLVQIFGVRVTDLNKTDFLVLTYAFEIIGSSSISTTYVAFDNHGSGVFPHDRAVRTALWVCSMDRLIMAKRLLPSAGVDLPLLR